MSDGFFTEANRTRAKEIVARYPRPKSEILPLAHLAQDQAGWLSPEAMDRGDASLRFVPRSDYRPIARSIRLSGMNHQTATPT